MDNIAYSLFIILFISALVHLLGFYKIVRSLNLTTGFILLLFEINFKPHLKQLLVDVITFKKVTVPENGKFWLKLTRINIVFYSILFCIYALYFVYMVYKNTHQ